MNTFGSNGVYNAFITPLSKRSVLNFSILTVSIVSGSFVSNFQRVNNAIKAVTPIDVFYTIFQNVNPKLYECFINP
jgi:hypothetical protein